MCEWCKKRVRRREPHHIFSRGSGRIDHRYNLISLCAVFSGGSNCHHEVHQGHILRESLLAIVAQREGVSQTDIRATLLRLRRADHAEGQG